MSETQQAKTEAQKGNGALTTEQQAEAIRQAFFSNRLKTQSFMFGKTEVEIREATLNIIERYQEICSGKVIHDPKTGKAMAVENGSNLKGSCYFFTTCTFVPGTDVHPFSGNDAEALMRTNGGIIQEVVDVLTGWMKKAKEEAKN